MPVSHPPFSQGDYQSLRRRGFDDHTLGIDTFTAEARDALGDEPYRLLLLPDHATPCAIKTHTSAPVPYLLFDSTREAAGGEYTERGVAGSEAVDAPGLMRRLLDTG